MNSVIARLPGRAISGSQIFFDPGACYFASITIGAVSISRLLELSRASTVTVQLPGSENLIPSTCHSPLGSCKAGRAIGLPAPVGAVSVRVTSRAASVASLSSKR
jgi:hypothetical protein